MDRRSLLTAVAVGTIAGAGAGVAAARLAGAPMGPGVAARQGLASAAAGAVRLNMVTSWPKGMPGLGASAERIAASALALSGGDEALAHAKTFSGNRPSSTLLLDRLDPATLGALIAFYEHRTFVAAVLLGINPFDQWGVELGKELANALLAGEDLGFDPSTAALVARAGL
jgi:hypothetical protein